MFANGTSDHCWRKEREERLMDDLTKRFFTAEDVYRLSRRQFLGAGAGFVIGGSLLAACGGGDDEEETAAATTAPSETAAPADTGAAVGVETADASVGEGQTIALILNGTNPYTQCLATGVLKELEGTGYGFIGVQGDFDSKKEVENFDAIVAQNPAGIIVLPNTPESAARGTLAAENAGIPVVDALWAQPSPADDVYVARIGIDNMVAGEIIAQWIADNTEPTEIGFITGVEGNEYSETLSEGIRQAVENLGGGWKVVAEQAGNWVRDPAIAIAEDYLTAYPNMKIIITHATGMGNGVAALLEREGLKEIAHISNDGDPEALDWVRSGWITALRYYSSAQEGRMGVVLLRDFLENGTRQPDLVLMEQTMMTADNVDDIIGEEPSPPNGLGPVCYEEHKAEAEKIA
jgi:inositol transport system substrate-binding protein